MAASSGRVLRAWNSLCSDRSGLLDPRSCAESGSAIWARSGVVVEPATGRLIVATGDGRFDGRTYWGDSVLLLSPDARQLLRNWTPPNYRELESSDIDLGSTAPALAGQGLAVQGGKDGVLRLLSLARLNGRTARAGPLTGGELQRVGAPGWLGRVHGALGLAKRRTPWIFGTNASGTPRTRSAIGGSGSPGEYRPEGRAPWSPAACCTSSGERRRRWPSSSPGSGRLLASLSAGRGRSNSPIVADAVSRCRTAMLRPRRDGDATTSLGRPANPVGGAAPSAPAVRGPHRRVPAATRSASRAHG